MEKRTYVCQRARMCSYLMEKGFFPYKVTPDKNNPKFDVYLFSGSPELYRAVMDYIRIKQKKNLRKEENNCGKCEKRV